MSEKETQLAQQLFEKTNARAIAWQPTARSNEFLAPFRGDVTFTIGRYANQYDNEYYKLMMRDQDGRELLELDTPDKLLGDLYKAAHDAALNVEETIDSVLDELRKVS
ncbi:MAG TPA: hypothetical protein VGU63_05725 [Candidatus Acidoferrales bacterium]|nr:hypothetical protein [Candidatus Acidoferrales bacterium]